MKKKFIHEESIEIPELLFAIDKIRTTFANITEVKKNDILVDMLQDGTFRFIAINEDKSIRYFAYCNIERKTLNVFKVIKMDLYTNEIIK